jgi:hypothetical protein
MAAANRVSEGDDLWKTVQVQTFERLPDSTADQRRVTSAISPN